MNKVILKQKEKQKEEKKPKKITKVMIQQRLINHFQHHIGERDKTTREEIFQKVIGVNSNLVDSFARFYWWSIIEKEIKQLRRKDKCFVIKKKGEYFVLRDLEEVDYYNELCDKAIKGMESAQIRAKDWVEKQKWRTISQYANPEEEEDVEEEEKIKSVEENLDELEQKAKNKVNKLWSK